MNQLIIKETEMLYRGETQTMKATVHSPVGFNRLSPRENERLPMKCTLIQWVLTDGGVQSSVGGYHR